ELMHLARDFLLELVLEFLLALFEFVLELVGEFVLLLEFPRHLRGEFLFELVVSGAPTARPRASDIVHLRLLSVEVGEREPREPPIAEAMPSRQSSISP